MAPSTTLCIPVRILFQFFSAILHHVIHGDGETDMTGGVILSTLKDGRSLFDLAQLDAETKTWHTLVRELQHAGDTAFVSQNETGLHH